MRIVIIEATLDSLRLAAQRYDELRTHHAPCLGRSIRNTLCDKGKGSPFTGYYGPESG